MAHTVKKDWHRPRPLEMYRKEPGFSYRWVRRDNVQRKKYEGYEVVRRKKKDKATIKKGKFGSAYKFRELILMRIPIKLRKIRDRHFQQRADRQMESVSRLSQNQAKLGLTTLKRLGQDKSMVDPVMEESVR